MSRSSGIPASRAKRMMPFYATVLATFSLVGPLCSAGTAFTITGDVEPATPATWTNCTIGHIGKTSIGILVVDGSSDPLSHMGGRAVVGILLMAFVHWRQKSAHVLRPLLEGRRLCFKAIVRGLLAVALVCWAVVAQAANVYWDTGGGTSNRDWSYRYNWSGNVEPTSADTAIIGSTSASNPTVNITSTGEVCKNLYVGYDYDTHATVNMTAGNLTVGTSFYLGDSGPNWVSFFYHSGGTTTVNDTLAVGNVYGAGGEYDLSNSAMLHTSRLYVGNEGWGDFYQSGGTNTIDGGLYLGYSTSSGASPYTNGYYGLGDGQLSAPVEYIGYNSRQTDYTEGGTFGQTGGTNTVSGKLYIGYLSGSNGVYTLGGNESTARLIINTGGEIRIGADSGTGRFEWFTSSALCTPALTLGSMGTLAMGFDFNVASLLNGTLFNDGSPGTLTGLSSASLDIWGNATATLASGTTFSVGNLTVGHWSSGTYVQNGGTNTISNTLYLSNNMGNSVGGTGLYTLNGGQLSATNEYLGYRNGNGIFDQSGGTNSVAGTLALGYDSAGQATYNLNGGVLTVRALTKNSATVAFNFGGGTLQASGAFSSDLPMTLTGTGGDANVNTNSYAVTLSGVLSGSGGLSKSGAGTLTLSAANNYTGDTHLVAGTLKIASNSLQGSTLNMVSGETGALSISGGVTLGGLKGNRNLSLRNNTTNVSIGSNNQSTTYSGVLSNTALTKVGSGTLTLTGANSYTGLTAVSAGVLAYGVNNAISTGDITVSSGTLSLGSYSDSVGAVSLISGAITGGTLTSTSGFGVQSGSASARLAGSVGLTKTTASTVTLSGANSYAGLTTVAGGTLNLVGTSIATPGAWNPVLNLGGADIQSGKMLFDYTGGTSPAATILDLLSDSYDGGLWDIGQFRSSTAVSAGLTLGWLDDPLTHTVTVMATYPGDFNLDGVVDAADRAIIRSSIGGPGTWATGDVNYDGVVNLIDWNFWKASLGRPSLSLGGSQGGMGVPEPGTVTLLLAGLLGLLACKRRR
jgi:autotransporter-associated beta strand protein